ncbi:sugar transferase [Demequina sp. SYSU T00192]|uniref:Sugar transferase n=1 Tax=Demequina litoralis TaxID=3051660 RepID=A0ABT8G8E0_9MICO|nr:sugar transferase [Demequina sp. SYSU T00192]MDN4475403.1 sugar transferase [Demequina sp. SYSU T00192]
MALAVSASTKAGAAVRKGSRAWAKPLERRIVLTDVFVVAMTMVIAHGVQFGWVPLASHLGTVGIHHWWITVAISALWIFELGWLRSRDSRILGEGPQEYQRVVSAGMRTVAIVAIVGFFTQWGFSRGYLLFALPLGTLVLLGYRRVWRAWLNKQRDVGRCRTPVIVAGPRRTSEQLVRRLRRNHESAYQVVGVCLADPSSAGLEADLEDVPVLGPIEDAAELVQRHDAGAIILTANDAVSMGEARRLGWALEGTDVTLIVAPGISDVAGPRVLMSRHEGVPLLFVDSAAFSGARYSLKDAVDRVGAAVLLSIAAIPMLIVAALVKLTSRGPVFFRQERIGKDGKPFAMLKFRSMEVGAEARLQEVCGDGVGMFYKPKNDPRVTRFGAFMRRYSIDELPQIINVLKGDMSLVGPRPQIAAEVEQYGDLEQRRLLVKPGMTGLWQVSGRSSLTPEASMELDAYYAENWSLGGDVVILLRTFWAVVGKSGAY